MKFITLLIIFVVVVVVFAWSCGHFLNKAIDQTKINYETPDTTIEYKHGKWDTTIIKKQVPSWLK